MPRKDPDAARSYNQQYRIKNRERLRAAERARQLRLADQLKIQRREQWAALTPEQKAARNVAKLEWRNKNRDLVNQRNREAGYNRSWPARLHRVHRITVEEFDAMIVAQSGLCAICSTQLVEPCIDHCHTRGHVRGVLCWHCNVGLGWFKDDPDLLRRAIAYLLAGPVSIPVPAPELIDEHDHPGDPKRLREWRNRLRYLHGLSIAEYEALLIAQSGRCSVCDVPLKLPFVDHCHVKGHVRGMLCRGCNSGIGFFKDSPTLLRSAIQYLARS